LTVDAEGERVGLTVGSVVPLSLEPALVGVGVSKQAAMHELLRPARRFALSLLAGDQEGIAQHFARGVPPLAHWHGITLRDAGEDLPLIADALGWLECETRDQVDAGDHTFFFGEVRNAERGRSGPPLVYLNRRYVSM
jgi:flavin reductase (DIM6/NTAB) family NADH-FMN oxidoreductase RutF